MRMLTRFSIRSLAYLSILAAVFFCVPPKISVMRNIQLGNREVGEIIEVELSFSNLGLLPLRVKPRNSSNGFSYKLKPILIGPRGKAVVPVTMQVRDIPGRDKCKFFFILESNDPYCPYVTIDFEGSINKN